MLAVLSLVTACKYTRQKIKIKQSTWGQRRDRKLFSLQSRSVLYSVHPPRDIEKSIHVHRLWLYQPRTGTALRTKIPISVQQSLYYTLRPLSLIYRGPHYGPFSKSHQYGEPNAARVALVLNAGCHGAGTPLGNDQQITQRNMISTVTKTLM